MSDHPFKGVSYDHVVIDDAKPGETIITLAERKKQKELEAADARMVDIGAVFLDPVTGCWLWKGDLDDGGYARHKGQAVHRLAFVIVTGKKLPAFIEPDHICRRRACIRPAHLDPVTRAVNAQRRNTERRVPLRCPLGHLMAGADAHGRTPEGGAFCKKCVEPKGEEMPMMKWLDEEVG